MLTLYSGPSPLGCCSFWVPYDPYGEFLGQHNDSLNKMRLSDCVSWVNASGGAVPADAWVAWAGDGGGRGREQVILWRPFCKIF